MFCGLHTDCCALNLCVSPEIDRRNLESTDNDRAFAWCLFVVACITLRVRPFLKYTVVLLVFLNSIVLSLIKRKTTKARQTCKFHFRLKPIPIQYLLSTWCQTDPRAGDYSTYDTGIPRSMSGHRTRSIIQYGTQVRYGTVPYRTRTRTCYRTRYMYLYCTCTGNCYRTGRC